MEPTTLSGKEKKRRSYILNGKLPNVILTLTFPLAVYAFFNYLYGFFDMIMVSHIGVNELASVVFIDEIKTAVTAFGAGIAAAGTVIVAREYGAGNIEKARSNAANSFGLAFLVSAAVVAVTVFFGRQVLSLLNAPEEVIQSGLTYFNLQMISTALMAVNAVFIGLEKAKGNTTLILVLNIVAMTIKLILSATFVYGLGKGTDYVALATVIAQGLLMAAALAVMFDKKNSLHLNLKELTLKKEYILPILLLALPVFSGKFLFSLGKVLVNSMAAYYGPLAIAAFGIALKLDGGAGSFSNVFEESETSIVSLNLGGRNLKRAVETGKIAQGFAFFVSIIGTALTVLCLGWMVPLFMKGANPALENMVLNLWEWERYSIITSAVIAVISGFFIGFKMSKVSFFLNIIRLFVFRLPIVLLLRQLNVGYESLGYAMFISNTMTMVIGEIIFVIFVHKVKNFGFMDMQYHEPMLEKTE